MRIGVATDQGGVWVFCGKRGDLDFRVQPGEEVAPLGTLRIAVRKPVRPPDRRHVLQRRIVLSLNVTEDFWTQPALLPT
jgi:hypothetical protein